MSRLIFKHDTHVVAYPIMNQFTIKNWAANTNVLDLMLRGDEDATPLSELYRSLGEEDGESLVEFGGRQCYRAWEKGRGHAEYIQNIIEHHHGSVLEHAQYSFVISGVSRTFTHELVRHRAGVAISQESQRYVDAKDIRFVVPPLLRFPLANNEIMCLQYEEMCEGYIEQYASLQERLTQQAKNYGFVSTEAKKRVNEASRSVLPGNAETRLLWSANLRTLRHVCEMRGSVHADLEIRTWAVDLTRKMKALCPNVFDDFEIIESEFEGMPGYVEVTHSKV